MAAESPEVGRVMFTENAECLVQLDTESESLIQLDIASENIFTNITHSLVSFSDTTFTILIVKTALLLITEKEQISIEMLFTYI